MAGKVEDPNLNDELDDDDDLDPKDDDDTVTMKQERMSRIMAREKDEGRRAGRREVLKEFDVSTVEELRDLLEAKAPKKKAEDDEASEAAAETARREAASIRREADRQVAEIRRDAKVERQLMAAGIDPTKVERVRAMLGDLDVEASKEEIATAVEDLAEDFPHLFKSATSDSDADDDDGKGNGDRTTPKPKTEDSSGPTGPYPVRSDPGRQPRTPPKPSGAKDRARDLLHERHPGLAENKS